MPKRRLSLDDIAAHPGVNPTTRERMPVHHVDAVWKVLSQEIDGWVKGGLAGAESSGRQEAHSAKWK